MSKFLGLNSLLRASTLLRSRPVIAPILVRKSVTLIPPSQYDIPISEKFNLGWALREHWEISPLIATSFTSFLILFIAIVWAFGNKVDAVYHTHCRENISRVMNLHHPTVHKMRVINQRYEPWPEMQNVLDKMKEAEHRVMVRAQTCSHP